MKLLTTYDKELLKRELLNIDEFPWVYKISMLSLVINTATQKSDLPPFLQKQNS